MREGSAWRFATDRSRAFRSVREISLQRAGGGEKVAANQFIKRRGTPMDFTMSERQREWLGRVQSFMKTHVRPAVPIYRQQGGQERERRGGRGSARDR